MKFKSILFLIFVSSVSMASFYQGQLRYISGFEFKQRLIDIGIQFNNYETCLDFSFFDEGRTQNLGANPPALGKPLFSSPKIGRAHV